MQTPGGTGDRNSLAEHLILAVDDGSRTGARLFVERSGNPANEGWSCGARGDGGIGAVDVDGGEVHQADAPECLSGLIEQQKLPLFLARDAEGESFGGGYGLARSVHIQNSEAL